MYWKEIPVQIQVDDHDSQVSRELDPRFQKGVDAIAVFDGSIGTDEYLTGWEWCPYIEATGSKESVSSAIAEYYNHSFPLVDIGFSILLGISPSIMFKVRR